MYTWYNVYMLMSFCRRLLVGCCCQPVDQWEADEADCSSRPVISDWLCRSVERNCSSSYSASRDWCIFSKSVEVIGRAADFNDQFDD